MNEDSIRVVCNRFDCVHSTPWGLYKVCGRRSIRMDKVKGCEDYRAEAEAPMAATARMILNGKIVNIPCSCEGLDTLSVEFRHMEPTNHNLQEAMIALCQITKEIALGNKG